MSRSAAAQQNLLNSLVPPQVTTVQVSSHGAAANKPIRPVNSYMAFRSYYSVIFTGAQQKAISVFMTFLWQEEPSKAKWAIIAKAYSQIRDAEGKQNAPLDQFLALSAPFIGIVNPRSYLRAHGWEVGTGIDGRTVLRRKVRVNPQVLGSNLGVQDVVRHIYANGYAPLSTNRVLPKSTVNLIMAATAQPIQSSTAASAVTSVAVMPGNTTSADQGALAASTTGTVPGPSVVNGISAMAGNTTTAGQMPLGANGTVNDSALDFLGMDSPISSPQFPVSDEEILSPATRQQIEDDVKKAHLKECASLKGSYPYHQDFEPGSETAAYVPFGGYGFDAFEISALNEFDFNFDHWVIDETI